MSTKSIVNWMNKTFDFTNLLKSRIVLYVFFILSISQLYTYSVTADYLSAVIFLLVGFLVSFFSNNMSVIMCFALSLSYMLKYGDSMRYENEGMTTKLEEGELNDNDSLSVNVSDELATMPDTLPSKTNETDIVIPETEKKNDKNVKKGMDKASTQMDEKKRAEYKHLLELQLKLITGISNMQPILSEVAKSIDNMKNSTKTNGF